MESLIHFGPTVAEDPQEVFELVRDVNSPNRFKILVRLGSIPSIGMGSNVGIS